MGEAIAAFGLAANIVQFIDFGSKLVSSAWSIHKNSRSAFEETFDLEKLTQDLKLTLVDLISPLQNSEDKTDSQKSLEKLAEQCLQLASEMLSSLGKIGLFENSRKRDALKAAFRLLWKEDEIKSQQMRLENIKHQLNLHILVSLREQARKSLSQQELVLSQLSAVYQGTQRLEDSTSKLTAEGIGSSLLDFLTAKLNQSGKNACQRELITAIYEDHKSDAVKDVSDLSVTSGRRKTLQSTIIARLRYPGMEDREGRIANAYEKTFQWIFDNPEVQTQHWSNFKLWLETNAPLYWITGKAGSGKSTLMKYICHVVSTADYLEPKAAFTNSQIDENSSSREPQTDTSTTRQSQSEKYLKAWANGSQLLIANFFFWNSGVELQMSKKGLLFSLLFQILQQCPELIPSACPNRWEALCLFNEDPQEWTKQELEEMLRSVAKALSQDAKLALFVDGLDEFDGQHDDLISLFQDLIANKNVKVCVSSRPWVLFEDAFKHKPSLTLDALTCHDIKHYVTSNLHGNMGFAQLRLREPTYAEQLVENVVSKASGVFLWVHLVVASLLAGMSYGDRVSDLQRRLDLLPPDLENLYNKILQSLDPFYLEHAVQLFKLIQASNKPPPLLLSFADEDTVEFALKQPIQPLSPGDLLLRAETMRRRVNSRCKGLLEVGRPATYLVELSEDTVQYLHRTVKDYIESTEVEAKLQSALKSPFDPYLRLCVGSIAHIKAIDDSLDFLTNGTLWTHVHRCLHSAARIQAENKIHIVPLLDELDNSGKNLALKLAKHSQHMSLLETGRTEIVNRLLAAGQWVPTHPLLSYHMFRTEFGCNFLSLVVRYGVVDYVQAKVNRGCFVQCLVMRDYPFLQSLPDPYSHLKNNTTSCWTGIWPLLQDAVYITPQWSTEYHDSVPSFDMIECLLNHGADPNRLFQTSNEGGQAWSVWKRLLPVLYDSFDGQELRSPWSDIARVMFKAGAEVRKDDMLALGPHYLEQKFKSWKQIEPFQPGWNTRLLFYEELIKIKKSIAGSWQDWIKWKA